MNGKRDIVSTATTFGNNSIGPEQIALDITKRCNMHCRHCYNRSNDGGGVGLGQELTDGELRKFAKMVREMRPVGLCFCGGEPLLRYDMIIEFMKLASNSFTRFNMVTNGYLMTLDKMRTLRDVGLNSLQVSIDGEDASTHEALRGVEGAYEKAIDALKMAIECEIPQVGIAFTPTRFNIDQFPCVATQMLGLGVGKVRIQPLMNLGAAHEHENIFPTDDQYRRLRGRIRKLQQKYGASVIEWGDPIDHIFRCSEILHEYFSHLMIRADGDIVISSYIPISVGNIKHHELSQYWAAGLWKVWGRTLFKEIASFYTCDRDFSREDVPLPQVFFESSIKFDLIDDHLLDISDKELYKLYWQRVPNLGHVIGCESNDACYLGLKSGDDSLNSVYLEFGRRSVNASLLEIKKLVDGLIRKHGAAERWRPHLRGYLLGGRDAISAEELKLDDLAEILEFMADDEGRIDFKYTKVGIKSTLTSGVSLRAKLFFETNRFFAIRDERRRICSLFSVCGGNGECSIAYAEFLIGCGQSIDKLVGLVKFATERIAVDEVFSFNRLRFVLTSGANDLSEELIKIGFSSIGRVLGSSRSSDIEILDIVLR